MTAPQKRRRSWPLAARLLASAAVLCAAILLVAGLALTTLYRSTAERSFDERLYVYLKEIVAAVSQDPQGKLSEAGNFGEPRFDLPLSGWYWQVDKVDAPGPSVGGSNSLVGARLQLLARIRRRGAERGTARRLCRGTGRARSASSSAPSISAMTGASASPSRRAPTKSTLTCVASTSRSSPPSRSCSSP